MGKARDLRRMKQCQLEGGHFAYESGDGMVVSLIREGTGPLSAESMRMDVRYEVESILSHRGEGPSLEYQVRWALWPNPTWEPAANIVGASSALRAYWS